MALTPEQVLSEVFGYSEFRGDQRAVITRTLSQKCSLVLMPTGMGKSLCYQIPARMRAHEGVTLVVSPLIALMKDQVDHARAKGLRATSINSSLSRDEREKRQRELRAGSFELVFVTPERFKKDDFWESLGAIHVTLFAVDEAHCISEWGHDFRPEYTRLGEVRERLGNPTTLALTATATTDVQQEIIRLLKLTDVEIFHSGMDRPNLSLRVYGAYGLEDKIRAFMAYHHAFPGPTIVYFSLISTLRAFSRELEKLSLTHTVYHGDLHDRARRSHQDDFLKGNVDLILATPAFGLGINKSDIRKVIHAEVPGSIESYYQEVGRAGRDGADAECSLLFDQQDISIQTDFLKWANPDSAFIQTVYHLIEANETRLNSEGVDYLRQQMNFFNSRDFRVETTLQLLERWDSIRYIEKPGSASRFPEGYLSPHEPPHGEWLNETHIHKRSQAQNKKLLQMVQYASQSQVCRMQSIHNYFGFSDHAPCGRCDVCRGEVHE